MYNNVQCTRLTIREIYKCGIGIEIPICTVYRSLISRGHYASQAMCTMRTSFCRTPVVYPCVVQPWPWLPHRLLADWAVSYVVLLHPASSYCAAFHYSLNP